MDAVTPGDEYEVLSKLGKDMRKHPNDPVRKAAYHAQSMKIVGQIRAAAYGFPQPTKASNEHD